MSKETIYKYLRQGGLSHNGACAMMGNMYCESLLKSDNVEDRCQMSDTAYTDAVNNGIVSRSQFCHDAYGYGLCQWTYYSRKDELWRLTVGKGITVADEKAQCDLCVAELKRDYMSLYSFLSTDCDLYTATSRICTEYEQPYYNNIDVRYNKAKEYSDQLHDDSPLPPTPPAQSDDSCEITVRVLRRGDLGRDVFLLQTGLQDMGIDCGVPDGDFGAHTEEAVNELKETVGLPMDGIADADVWQIIFQ